MSRHDDRSISRRGFLRAGVTALGASSLAGRAGAAAETVEKVTIGVYTDAHYADQPHRGARHYRDSQAKLQTFVREMNRLRPDFVIELGDFIDSGPSFDAEMAYLEHIEKLYRGFQGKRYHVIGNHDLARFSKKDFMRGAGMKSPHYSFDCGPLHCVVLDANYNQDFTPYVAGKFKWTETYVAPSEQQWLTADLKKTRKKTVVFIHQRLDDVKDPHGVKNGPAVRKILESSGKVLAVFQGHDHRGNCKRINGIHYFTHRAMVEGPGAENNSYALVTVSTCGRIEVKGFCKQVSHVL